MGEIIAEGGLSVLPGGTYPGVSQGRSRCSDPDTGQETCTRNNNIVTQIHAGLIYSYYLC